MTGPEVGMAVGIGVTVLFNTITVVGAGMLQRGKLEQFQKQSEEQHAETKKELASVKESVAAVAQNTAVLAERMNGVRRDLDEHTRTEEQHFEDFRRKDHDLASGLSASQTDRAVIHERLNRLERGPKGVRSEA